ncbi:uncharacterized protein DUF2752 [Mobilisporobacter senegalensis]|uniref:Uncharacterized protein DUF2752 n=1 Tax=Mobilisporobacter senegalensis TaxID=1329262 RepID=A0A3N1XSM5_9FIRM|nr:DUF2752 domain-containing protein [Mobilisporobacter senegalensis]ROR28182.1 uncharacterized protein DUF2752 [Mobilisporobacter senegalensis]
MKTALKQKIIIIGCLLLYILIIYFTGYGCPFRFFLGLSCPGCGMTRAWVQVLHLHFADAFYFHPLYFLVPIMGIIWLFEDKINPKWNKFFWIIIALLFIVVYFIRFQNSDQDIVTFNFMESFLYKIFHLF